MKKIAVLTSGGDSPGMNAAIRSVALKANYHQVEPIAVQYGYRGLIEKNFLPLMNYNLEDMVPMGGTKLYTSRFPEFSEEGVQKEALANLRAENIDGLVVIGGDGSYKGALALANLGFPTVAIPGTIDNDVGGTDFSIGFDTAINTAVDAIDKIRDTATSHERIFVVEVMGRKAGDIAYWSAISTGADMAVIPEVDFTIDGILKDIDNSRLLGNKRYIIVLSEGVMKGHELADQLSADGRHKLRVSQLGHIQRGGSPSPKDRVIATRLASAAVEALLEGESGIAIGMRNTRAERNKISDVLERDSNFISEINSKRFDFLFG